MKVVDLADREGRFNARAWRAQFRYRLANHIPVPEILTLMWSGFGAESGNGSKHKSHTHGHLLLFRGSPVVLTLTLTLPYHPRSGSPAKHHQCRRQVPPPRSLTRYPHSFAILRSQPPHRSSIPHVSASNTHQHLHYSTLCKSSPSSRLQLHARALCQTISRTMWRTH